MPGRKRDKQLKFFVTDSELEQIKSKVATSQLNQSDFLRESALKKEIVVIDGLREFALELKRIGVNMNQLTKLAHQERIVNSDQELAEIHEEMKEVWLLLKQLARKKARH